MSKHLESKAQIQFIRWSNHQRLDLKQSPFYFPLSEPKATINDYLFAIPNGGSRATKDINFQDGKRKVSMEAARMKQEGVKAGVHDLLLSLPINGYHGLYIEVKAPVMEGKTPNTVSKEQKEWGKRMIKAGYAVVFCWGFNELVDAVTAYFNNDVEALKRFSIPSYGRKAKW